jgi:hypothetical protein
MGLGGSERSDCVMWWRIREGESVKETRLELGEKGFGFFGEPGFGVEGDGLLGEFAGGGWVTVVSGEEGEVVAGDAAIGGVGGLVVAGAKVRFGFGVLAAFGEECAEGAVQGGHAWGKGERFANAEFGKVVEFGFFVDDGDAGELVEQAYFSCVRNKRLQCGRAFSFEAAVVLHHHGVKLFGEDGSVSFGLIGQRRIGGNDFSEKAVRCGFDGRKVV